MRFLKKTWPFAIAALVVICISTFVLSRGQEPVSPRKTYKATPASNSNKPVDAAHSHDTVGHAPHPHSHPAPTDSEAIPSGEAYDWRDDSRLDSTRAKSDLWKQTFTPAADAEPVSSEDSEAYPPPNWYKTEDPELFIEYFRAQLIKQFGDINEVHIVVDREKKRKMGIPVSLDEQIAFLEANYKLWRSEKTLQVLRKLRKIRTEARSHHDGSDPHSPMETPQ